ncbi:hypothetical protein OG21DRAFT_1528036 [Imleria badia]|nr:hypothetical protein OG21DRAFT_1528036 [Imleria badia]
MPCARPLSRLLLNQSGKRGLSNGWDWRERKEGRGRGGVPLSWRQEWESGVALISSFFLLCPMGSTSSPGQCIPRWAQAVGTSHRGVTWWPPGAGYISLPRKLGFSDEPEWVWAVCPITRSLGDASSETGTHSLGAKAALVAFILSRRY